MRDDEDVVVLPPTVSCAETSPGDASPAASGTSSSSSTVPLLLSVQDMHGILAYTVCSRMSISALRSCSRAWRESVETVPSSQSFGSAGEIFISRNGAYAIYNPRRVGPDMSAIPLGSPMVLPVGGTTGISSSSSLVPVVDARGSFALHSINPVGRKFRDETAAALRRNAVKLSNTNNSIDHSGLCMLHLHHATITSECFTILGDIPTLVELQLVMCRGIKTLREASRMASLEVLDVLMCDLTSDGLDGLFLPHLRRLKVKRCPRLESINGIAAETLASLVELRIEDCPLLADDCCRDAIPQLRCLERLSLTFTATSEFLLHMSSDARGQLKELDLSQTNCSTEVLQAITEDMKLLEVLRLEECEAVLSVQPLEALTTLVALDISGNDNAQLDALVTLGNSLRSLRIADAPFLQCISFIRALTLLEVLDLSRSGVGDAEIIPLGALKNLNVLFLTGCSSVTNLNPLGGCKELKKLFAGATSLTYDGSVLLANCKLLEELDVSNTEIQSVNHLSGLSHLRILNAFGSLESVADAAEVMESGRVQVLMDNTLALRDTINSMMGGRY